MSRRRRNKDRPEWQFVRMDDPFARMMATIETPWFVEWFRGLQAGRVECLHCGATCGADVGMAGAVRLDSNQLLTVTVCWGCYSRSPTFEDAGRAALAAAEAGLLSRGRSFTHGIAAPEGVQ